MTALIGVGWYDIVLGSAMHIFVDGAGSKRQNQLLLLVIIIRGWYDYKFFLIPWRLPSFSSFAIVVIIMLI